MTPENTTEPTNQTAAPDYGIIVHCHLRWDFVWQRPQHVVSRLSKFHPVLFLEDAYPLPQDADSDNQPRMELTRVSDTLTVARPLLLPLTGDKEKDVAVHKANGEAWGRLLDTTVKNLGWKNLVHWFYTPMAVGARNRYNPVAIAYDCMDELANFKGAPASLKQKEVDLMASSDVVFTGGPSMYAARKDNHPNVHLFNSGVDVAHFQKAMDASTVVPDDAANLAHPVLLYYGVIDERMGWDNLAAVCDAHPEWSVLMVGPLAKITEADLLRKPNLHYTGQRGYEDLPGYLKGCDVALVPFALSDATRYLSPTKTLEYFAAQKPVVSTPIQDIVDHYTDAARIAYSPEEFVTCCEAALVQSDENAARIQAGAKHADAQTWDRIVESMRGLLDAAVAKNLSAPTETGSGETNGSGDTDGEMATGQVRWYSGSRGAGVVDTGEKGDVMAFMPGEAQENLGGVREGDSVAVGGAVSATPTAGPSHIGRDDRTGTSMFPTGLDRIMGSSESGQAVGMPEAPDDKK